MGVEVIGSPWSRPSDVAAAAVLLGALVGSLLSLPGPDLADPSLVELSGPGGRGDFAWGVLTGVRVGPRPGTVTLLGFDGASVKLPVAELRSDPQLVARLVEHYRAHRGDRAELTDGRALQRVREGWLRAPRPRTDDAAVDRRDGAGAAQSSSDA